MALHTPSPLSPRPVLRTGWHEPGPGWHGYAAATRDDEGWIEFWRIDPRGEDMALSRWHDPAEDVAMPPFWWRSITPAGVHGMWSAAGGAVSIEVLADPGIDNEMGQVDILVGGRLATSKQLVAGAQVISCEATLGAPVEIWLPQIGGARVREPDGVQNPRSRSGLRWTTYGSSITQCGAAAGPSEAWPAIIARTLDWDSYALGLGGECHLDGAAERAIAHRPADVVSLCLGINSWTAAAFGPRTLGDRVAQFLRTVRTAHPDAPVVVMTPIAAAAHRELERNGDGLSLNDYRSIITAGASGLPGTRVVDGRDLISADEATRLLGDDLHPSAEGYQHMARRLLPILQEAAGVTA